MTPSRTLVTCANCGRRNRVPSAAAAGSPRCGNCHAPLPWIADAGDHDFAEVADRSSVPVVVDLWAPWCGPCRMISPALERLAEERPGTLKLVRVNVDEAPEVSRRFAVQGIPTLIVLVDGRVIATQTGAAPEAALRQWLNHALHEPAG